MPPKLIGKKGEREMVNFTKSTPQIPVILAFLILWVSFAWALPGDTEASGGGAEVALEDPWAGVRISGAYDYAKCPRCGKKNEIRAKTCSRCGYELPQPSAEVTDPYLVFVPGRGYYNEGEIIEPGRTRTWVWITGLVIAEIGVIAVCVASEVLMWEGVSGRDEEAAVAVLITGGALLIGGGIMALVGFCNKTDPIYAFHTGELDEGYDGVACGRRPVDPGNLEFKIEVPVLSF